jgi:hypothetical protein
MSSSYKNYLEMYLAVIKPAINNIDIFIKSSDYYSLKEVCNLLGMSEQEVIRIMNDNDIAELNRRTFFTILSRGSNPLCIMYRKEMEVGSPYIYSKDNIAYIYNINLESVIIACEKLKIEVITKMTLPLVFNEIPYISTP